jgi:hypothetical protein
MKSPQNRGALHYSGQRSPSSQSSEIGQGEGAVSDDDFAGEAHAAFGGDIIGFGGEASDSLRAIIRHDALPYLACKLSWVCNHCEHQGCSLEVNVWVSSCLNTQNREGT